jgi:DNA-binding transcriptional ArsR family regulator/uncharacterized protein YndB with AHSA1/START domain
MTEIAASGDRDIQKVLAALAAPTRREILALIWDDELAAGEIAAAFDLSGATISEHLAVLRDAGLVTMTADGTFRRYRARQDVLRGLRAALGSSVRWTPADDIPEAALTHTETKIAVVAHVDVPTNQETTFAALTNPAIYSRWLGVPVTINNGRFACTMEWGTRIRGHYDVICPPELIALRWDFDDDNVPVPGGEMTGYMRVKPRGRGAHVEVHQLVDDLRQAEFMEVAWSVALGRLKAGVAQALKSDAAIRARPTRPKNRRSGEPAPEPA